MGMGGRNRSDFRGSHGKPWKKFGYFFQDEGYMSVEVLIERNLHIFKESNMSNDGPVFPHIHLHLYTFHKSAVSKHSRQRSKAIPPMPLTQCSINESPILHIQIHSPSPK